MPLEGVGFPGHFLVRLAGEPRDLLLDPYREGMTVHEEDCRRMLRESTGGRIQFEARHIASVGKRDMVERLLRNLKGAYLRLNDDHGALAAVDRLLVLAPEDADEMRDRGLLLFRLRRWSAAHVSLAAYLERAPEAPDRETIRGHLVTLRSLIASLN
jgi:regulator of sirC expression with transglutaminase-like and TPR domain